MEFRRAISIDLLTYIASLAISWLGLMVLGVRLDLSQPLPSAAILLSMVVALLVTFGGADWYFSQKKVPAGALHGLLFGILATVTAMVLDLVIAIAAIPFGSIPSNFIGSAYSFWFFIPMLIIGLGGCAIIGAVKEKPRRRVS